MNEATHLFLEELKDLLVNKTAMQHRDHIVIHDDTAKLIVDEIDKLCGPTE